MRHLRFLAVAIATSVALGCAQDSATAPANSASMAAASEVGSSFKRHGLTVLSQNIYVGADVDAIITALNSPDPNDDIPVLVQQIGVLGETDFPTRAAALARIIARERPDLVGLSEVSRIDIDLPPLGIAYHVDFGEEIGRALRREHLPYRVAASIKNFTAAPAPGISLVDYDIVLVNRDRVRVGSGVVSKLFTNNVGPIAPGVSLSYGFVSVPVTVAGVRYKVVTTHLQDDVGGIDLSLLRASQMQDIVVSLGDAPHAVVMGDMNDGAGTPMYQVALAGGFSDVWAVLEPGSEGFTCCHSSTLTDARIPDQRIDLILARGLGRNQDPVVGLIRRLGVLPSEMFPGPAHPIFLSDHLGLLATLHRPE